MKPSVDYEELLRDVLVDEDLLALKKNLHARCRRELAFRRKGPALWLLLPAAAAVLLLLAGLFFSMGEFPKPDRLNPGDQAGAGCAPAWLVRTRPLAEENVVQTSATSAAKPRNHHVSTPPERRAGLLVTTRMVACVVTTEEAPPVKEITDREMLALFPGVPRALIDTGKKEKKLFFFNAEDKERFLAGLD